MAFASKSLLVSLLMLVILTINIEPSLCQNTQQLIEQICRSTEDYGFCQKTFQSHLKAPNADIVALTQITVEVADDHATKTNTFIRQTIATTRDPLLKKALAECQNAYLLITQAFGSAAVLFFSKDYSSVENAERITPRAEASCEATLSTPPLSRQRGILDERSRQMRIYISMALNAVQDLQRPRSLGPVAAAPAPALH